MTASAAGQPHHLRLVGDASQLAQALHSQHVERKIATENRRAAATPHLMPTDPRWVLAARAYSQLEGSTLTPERRQRVLKTAQQLGVRPFDANVIIAIVQDNARTGRTLADAAPTLTLLSEGEASRGRSSSARSSPARSSSARSSHQSDTAAITTRWLAAFTLAAAANLILIWWLLYG